MGEANLNTFTEALLDGIPVEVVRQIVVVQNRIAGSMLDLGMVMNVIAEQACTLLGADGAAVELLERDEMVYRAVAGRVPGSSVGMRLKLDASFSGTCVLQSRALVCEDSELDPRVDLNACRALGVRSMAVVPLVTSRATVGALKVMAGRPHRFAESHQKILTVLGSFLATAVSYAREAESQLQQFKDLANALPQLAWIADGDGWFYWFNDRWYAYTGTDLSQVEGWVWQSVLDPADLPRVNERWRAALASGGTFETESRLRAADGSFRWFLTRATPVRGDDGTVVRWFGTVTDVHDGRVLVETLRAAKEAAERASDLKSSFLANMSHEIRTPLAAMMGFADLLGDPAVAAGDRANYAEILYKNGERLGRVINDILDLSKVETGHVSFEYSATRPRAIVDEVVTLMSVVAHAKGLRLEVIDEGTAPAEIVTDPTRVRQILMNLVSNALKFTDSGRVAIELRGSTGAGGRTGCEICVTDTGAGIHPDAVEKLFKVFSQADESMTRKYGGTGLGLALSRSLARAMGGDVTLRESREGAGSTFVFRIEPRTDRASTAAAVVSVDRRAALGPVGTDALNGVRVLLVEDSPDNQELIVRYLTRAGARVSLAADGREGVSAALAGDHDIVLMDLQMPIMDGYTAVGKLRARGFAIPIVALTAHAMSDVAKKCRDVGCSAHLPKPIDPRELIATIRHLTKERCRSDSIQL